MILDPVKHWECPSCGAQHVTREHRPHVPMHPCPALRGMVAPYADADLARTVTHRVRVREDYVNGDDVRLDDAGTPVMAVELERPDGSADVFVMAPTAHGGASVDH